MHGFVIFTEGASKSRTPTVFGVLEYILFKTSLGTATIYDQMRCVVVLT